MYRLKRYITFRLLSCFSIWLWIHAGVIGTIQAQQGMQDQVWVFGNQAGVDFNTDPPTTFSSMSGAHEGSASVTDRFGRLLFYTDGSFVYNRQNRLMPNGINLTGIPGSFSATHSTAQGAVIVPVTDQPGRYYIFSLSDNALTADPNKGKLYYSVVDMNLDGGLGDVLTIQKGVLLDTGLTEHMTSAPADNCDIWLMVVSKDWQLRSYRIPSSGTLPMPVVTPLLPILRPDQWNVIGKMEVSPDGRWLVMARKADLSLYHFDPVTGTATQGGYISDREQVNLPSEHYSVCFSHGSSKLYVTNGDTRPGLYQFDLSSGSTTAIAASKYLLGMPVGGGIKRAPDGRIYFGSYQDNRLHVIHKPDESGAACLFEERSLALAPGSSATMGLTNIVVAPILDERTTSRTIRVPCDTAVQRLEPAAVSGWHYLWDNGDTTATRAVTISGTYWLEYRTPCAVHRDSFIVDFPPAFSEPEITGPCRAGDRDGYAVLQASASLSHIEWLDATGNVLSDSMSVTGLGGGDYRLRMMNSYGCDTLLIFKVIPSGFEASFVYDSVVCVAEAVGFRFSGAMHYDDWRWDFGDGNTATGASVANSYAAAGVYTVALAVAGNRCADTVSHRIVVEAQPAPFPFYTNNDRLCAGDTISLYAVVDGRPQRLEWNIGNDRRETLPSDTVRHAAREGGILVVNLTAHFRACAPVSYRDTFEVHDAPQSLSLPDQIFLPCKPGGVVLLDGTASSGGDSAAYLWGTGARTSVIRVTEPGTYRLEVRSATGCSTVQQVTVAHSCSIRIPNAFTPDGDGVNDRFFRLNALSNGVSEAYIQIFNRWGLLIYQTTNPADEGWDGTFNGVRQPRGVYVYRVQVRYVDGRTETYQGNVTLLN